MLGDRAVDPSARRVAPGGWPFARVAVAVVAAVALLATVVISVLPFVGFAYRSVPGHAALETAAALIGMLAAYLVAGRFRRTRDLRDLALATALGVLAGTNLAYSTLPALVGDPDWEGFSTWAPVAGRLAGAVGMAVAAFLPSRRLLEPTRAAARAAGGALVGLTVIGVLAAVLAVDLPQAVEPGLSPESSGRPRIVGHTGVLTVQLAGMLCFAAAAVGFLRRHEHTGDDLFGWFAVASVLAAASRLNYFLFPSLYSEWLYVGDFLRLAFYVVLAAGAAREIARYQSSVAQVALLEDRRRVARELHDGLAQELAFIATQTRSLERHGDRGGQTEMVRAAAERALDESRAAISALSGRLDVPLHLALARTAEEVARRGGAAVQLQLAEDVDVGPTARHALARIVREAVSNAVRHGDAATVTLRLWRNGAVRLRIEDDGTGFDPARVGNANDNGGGYGLTTMRERAEALGGRLVIVSQPGAGTCVEVEVP